MHVFIYFLINYLLQIYYYSLTYYDLIHYKIYTQNGILKDDKQKSKKPDLTFSCIALDFLGFPNHFLQCVYIPNFNVTYLKCVT